MARVPGARSGRMLAAAVLLFAVTACGAAAPPDAAPPDGAAADGAAVPLRIATGTDLTSSGVRRKIIEEAARDLDLRVSFVELPDDADRQRSQLVAALQAGNQDAYDIVNLDVTWTHEFAAQGLIEPLEGDLAELDVRAEEDIWPSVRSTVEYDGKAWAVPWNTDVGLLYYRADLLGADPELRTWQELIKTVQGYGREPGGPRVGLVTQLDSYEGLTVNTHEAVWRNGGEIVSDEGEVRVADEKAVRGLFDLADAFAARGNQLPVLGEGSLDSDETGSIRRFLAGEALAMRNWPFARFLLKEHMSEPDGSDANAEVPRYGVTALPAGKGAEGISHAVLGGQNLAIADGSSRQRDARRLIGRITSVAAGEKLHAGGFVPAHRSALPGKCSEGGRSLPGRVPQGEGLDAQYVEALCWSMKHAWARPATPYYGAVTRDIQDVMTRRLRDAPKQPPLGTGKSSPEDLRDLLADSLRGR